VKHQEKDENITTLPYNAVPSKGNEIQPSKEKKDIKKEKSSSNTKSCCMIM
jgi:hypothetical protein